MKKKFSSFFIFLMLSAVSVDAQLGWTWTELAPMPTSISNNATCEAQVGNDFFLYSFSGIDATKLYSGINLNSYKYNVQTDSWTTITSLPDTMGKIAAGASFVNDKIYIIGGYYVTSGGQEYSSSKVHVYDPASDTYMADGADIPTPIDDHVQAVWRDSLIYVITGWSNIGNVPDVQIYNPYLNSWSTGTDTPNNNSYKAFGASGTIVGDTIYYNGGVRGGFNFVSTSYLRKGVIDPTDPTQITWTLEEDNPGAKGYRMACSNYQSRIFWLGGAGTAYNYNGIAYSGGQGVEPLGRILQFEKNWDMWFEGLGSPFGVMDLRGIAKISASSWIIAGGMESGQVVSNKTYRIDFDPIVGSVSEHELATFEVYPNPVVNSLQFEIDWDVTSYQLVALNGQLISEGGDLNGTLAVSNLKKGVYMLILKNQIEKKVAIGRFVK